MTSHMQDLFQKFRKDGEHLLEQISKLRERTVFPILFHIQASMAPWVTSRIYDRLNRFGQKIEGDVDVVLFSGGGDPDTAFHIGKILNRMTEGNLTYIIPRYAASAATLLALSGNKILMGPPSELSPIDPQIEVSPNRFVSAHSVRESFNLIFEAIIQHPELPKTTVEALLEKLPITEVVDYDRLLDHTEELAFSLLKLRMIKDESRAKEIANKLVRGYKHHARSISIDDAIELGLEVEEPSPELWNLIWEFHKKWETVALVLAKEGSNILALDIGNGLAFIPSEIAEEEKSESPSLQSLLNRM